MERSVAGPAVACRWAGRFSICAVAVLLLGCGATGTRPAPTPVPPKPTAAPSTAPPSTAGTAAPIPAGGVGLPAFGIEHGPASFSLPRATVTASVVDQPNNVVVVLSAPAPAEVAGYLRRTLPGAGFEITDTDPGENTFTFLGAGWFGSFTTGAATSAILLRPR